MQKVIDTASVDQIKSRIADLAREASVELGPHQLGEENFQKTLEELHKGRRYSITSIPPKSFEEVSDPLGTTIAAAIRLKQNMGDDVYPVPHIAVRNYRDMAQFEEGLARLQGARIDEILLVAGDNQQPGEIKDTLVIIQPDGAGEMFAKYGITKIAFAGHPQGNPNAADCAATEFSFNAKSMFARKNPSIETRYITQLCFKPKDLTRWAARQQDSGLSIVASIFAPLKDIRAIYRNARRSGYRLKTMGRNAMPMGLQYIDSWARGENPVPDRLILAIANSQNIHGIHVFPFGSLKRANTMLDALEEGRFKITRDMLGRRRLRIDGFAKDYNPIL